MIKIGDFSRLANISIKTLHYYDQLGLLQPVHVDRYSGYRFYSLDQLPQLNRILALKELGFSLDQVRRILAEEEVLSAEELHGMLRIKRAELRQLLDEEEARLRRVECRLKQIEKEGQLPVSEVAVKVIPEQMVLTAVEIAPTLDDLGEVRRQLQHLLDYYLRHTGLRPVGPWFTLLETIEFSEQEVPLTLAVPVQGSLRAASKLPEPLEVRRLPGVAQAASIIHTPDCGALPAAYASLYSWMQRSRYHSVGPWREIYLSGFPQDSQPELIEVQCPVELVHLPLSLFGIGSDRKEQKMEPKIIEKPAMTLVGIQYFGKNENNEIADLWSEFVPHMFKVKNLVFTSFGFCDEPNENGEFVYIAASQVSKVEDLPEGWVVREVPANKYAVFTHHGLLDTLKDTYDYIYQTWLPQSGLELAGKYDMEVYDEKFKSGSPDSIMYIYLPVK